MPTTRSERASLAHILTMVRHIQRALTGLDAVSGITHQQRYLLANIASAAQAIEDEARGLHTQVARGVHTNPPLVVYGNPPLRGGRAQGSGGPFRFARQLSDDVHGVRYTHLDDGKDYKHDFERHSVSMYGIERAGRRDVLLTHLDGKPLWEDV